MQKIDFQLTVSPNYVGEYSDAVGMQSALRRNGYTCIIHAIDPVDNIGRKSDYEHRVITNISFHSSFLPNTLADRNILFYHEVHDKFMFNEDDGSFEMCNEDRIPFNLFGAYDGVMTPSNRFAVMNGCDKFQLANDPDVYYKTRKRKSYECDVVFIGSVHKSRDIEQARRILLPLADEGYVIHVYGGGWTRDMLKADVPDWKVDYDNIVLKGKATVTEAREIYSSAKVGLNFVCEGMVAGGSGTNRLYNMCACGLASVSYGCSDYYNAYGVENPSVLWANTPSEFVENTEKLLNDDKLRKDMSKRALKITNEQHQWDNRVDELLRIVEYPTREYMQDVDEKYPWAQIHLGIPSKDITTDYAVSLPKFFSMGREPIPIDIQVWKSSYDIGSVRNDICEYSLHNNIPWTLMIDDDNPMEPFNLECLLDDINRGLPVIFGWYRNSNTDDGRFEPDVKIDDGNGNLVRITDPPSKIIKVSMASTGFVAIHKAVLELFRERGYTWFNYISKWNPLYKTYGLMGEDTWFCNVCKTLGIPIYLDGRIYCGHDRVYKDNRDRKQSRVY